MIDEIQRTQLSSFGMAAIVIGVAVDDCIHVLSVYQRQRASGLDRSRAMARAVVQVGRAVVTSSIALALGFFALTLSSWSTISHFGALAGLAILVALVAVVGVLPAWVAAPCGGASPRRYAGARSRRRASPAP
jgi:predicted RND superfamily exporter protein